MAQRGAPDAELKPVGGLGCRLRVGMDLRQMMRAKALIRLKCDL